MPAPPSQHFSFSPFPPFPSPHPSSLAPLLRPVPFQFAHVALPILPLPFLLSHRPPPTYQCIVGSRMSHVAAEARSTFALCFRMLVYKRRLFLRGSSSVPVCARSRSGGQTAVFDCVVFFLRARSLRRQASRATRGCLEDAFGYFVFFSATRRAEQ